MKNVAMRRRCGRRPGTVVNKAGAAPGFTLFAAGSSGAHLIDNAGRVAHHWERCRTAI